MSYSGIKKLETTQVYSGIPQGFTLGPLLISIYMKLINELVCVGGGVWVCVSSKLNCIIYVDDTIIYFKLED